MRKVSVQDVRNTRDKPNATLRFLVSFFGLNAVNVETENLETDLSLQGLAKTLSATEKQRGMGGGGGGSWKDGTPCEC